MAADSPTGHWRMNGRELSGLSGRHCFMLRLLLWLRYCRRWLRFQLWHKQWLWLWLWLCLCLWLWFWLWLLRRY